MHHKWMVFFTTLVLLSLLISPVGMAQAQNSSPDCPPYERTGSLERERFLHSLPVECIHSYKELASLASPGTSAQDAQPMAAGGPDIFGYIYDDSVAYNWISATQNSGLVGDDAFTGPIDIGFDFPFYGIPQSQAYLSINGLITFGVGSWDSYGLIPSDQFPNNFIASFWDDLEVGSPYNNGAIYYSRGGSAPNRYFVVEWRDAELAYGTIPPASPFSFEVILHENGDVVLQYQSVPSSTWAIVGMEDSAGSDGLEYSGSLSTSKAIRFYYPTTSTARLLVSPAVQAGGFSPLGGYKDFSITITNTGNLGSDTYDLNISSSWPITFYASNGVTQLTDTDADTVIDTGSIPQGVSTTVIARVATPNGAQIGDDNNAAVTITSSLNASKTKIIHLLTTIPASFANVFEDEANGAMSFMTVDSKKTSTHKATGDNYAAWDVAMAKSTDNNYFYVWNKLYYDGPNWVAKIEFALLNSSGNIIRPVTKLTDNTVTTVLTQDRFPAVSVAPNGTIGVVWDRYLKNLSTNQSNDNIYFATLDASGNLLTGPTNITNNTAWGTSADFNIPSFDNPTIAATDDNRFVISWEELKDIDAYNYTYNIWYAIRDTAGINIFSPHALTSDNVSRYPFLNSLTGGKVILTWQLRNTGKLYYAVINNNGDISLSASLDVYPHGTDAVQLPNGKVAIAGTVSTGVWFTILNSSYLSESSATANTAFDYWGLSVTTDASSRVIMTWGDSNKLIYALGDSNGTFITEPMLYKTSENLIEVSWNGQGNAPYDPISVTSIRGNTGVGGVTLRFTDGISQSVTSDTSGNYLINVPVGWSGTVTPSKAGYTFTPVNRTYSNLQTDQTGQDYTAQALTRGADTTGVFRPSNGALYLKHKNETGFADVQINYGLGGDYPVVGDWDGDGTVTIGIYRNGSFYLRNENTIGFADVVFPFGAPGDQPVAGDWDGDGDDTIGVYRNGTFFLRNSNDAGAPDMIFGLGNPGDVGIAGDWDGDGMDTTGVFRPSNGALYLKNTNETGFADVQINYGLPGDKPVTGDWNNDGIDTIGIYRNGSFYLRNENTIGFADLVFALGIPGDMPIAGNWDGSLP